MSTVAASPPADGASTGALLLPERGVGSAASARSLTSLASVRLLDAGMLALAGAFAVVTSGEAHPAHVGWAALFAGLTISLASSGGVYRPRLDLRLLDTVRGIVSATVLATAIVISLRVVVEHGSSPVAASTGRLWIFATLFLVAGRLSVAFVARRANAAGTAGHPPLIVGAGRVGQLVAARLRARPQLGLRPVGFLDKEPLPLNGAGTGLPVLGASWHLDAVVAEHGIRHVIVTFSTAPTDVLMRLMNRCEQLGVRTSFVPRLFEKTTEEFAVDRLGGLPLISTHAASPSGSRFAVKYALDRVLAAVAIAILSPLLGVLALAVLVSLGRPILYRQERIGRDGERFDMLKFRSMRPAADGEATAVTLSADTAPGGVEGTDRRTRVGSFMRRTSLDELPQILNVLNGDMSFVGPRPERPEFVAVFEQSVHRYADRHRVKSGITGWAQVNGLRGKTSVADRAEWDNYYIDNWSLWFDFKILLQTVLAIACPGD